MSTPKKDIRVIIADDHPVVRKGLRMALEEFGAEIELVGEAEDGTAAVQLVEEIQPDVVLLDIRMPGMDGLEALEHMHASSPQVAVVILTTYNEDAFLLRGLQAGACGYLLKDCPLETLLHAIRAAARGERSKEIAAHLGLTRRTVETYLTNIYLKLEVDSRAAAVAVALEQGLLRPKES